MRVGIIDDDYFFIELFKEKYYPQIISLSSDMENDIMSYSEIPSVDVLNTCDLVFLT